MTNGRAASGPAHGVLISSNLVVNLNRIDRAVPDDERKNDQRQGPGKRADHRLQNPVSAKSAVARSGSGFVCFQTFLQKLGALYCNSLLQQHRFQNR